MPVFGFFNGVLLARIVEGFLPLAEEGIINYSPEELSLVVSEPSGLLKAALRIKSSELALFDCNVNSSVRVNLAELYMELSISNVEDSLTIYVGDEDYIGFQFHNTSTGGNLYSVMMVTQIHNENMDINAFQYFYEVAVCIPSQEFRNLITHLRQFGSTVFMTVKKSHVTFQVGGVETTLSTWNNQCCIGGVANGNFLCSMFSLDQMRSLWSASLLPSHVWIGSSGTFNCMLNYRLAAGIAINYYFL